MVRRFGGASRKRQGGHLVRTSAEEAGRYGSGSGCNLQLIAHGARHQPRAVQARQNQLRVLFGSEFLSFYVDAQLYTGMEIIISCKVNRKEASLSTPKPKALFPFIYAFRFLMRSPQILQHLPLFALRLENSLLWSPIRAQLRELWAGNLQIL
ncbi:hypothetical protein DdX_17299 [Ditylenchus destructor]|uniref:Uncharacterized protein n=1 Tax=Ditylenchus destructor TaxID=166010 RepID=A0AAD4QZ41_9BILA|nr:hypothetical protein DdX_17299 [Ditylenchus destructor]